MSKQLPILEIKHINKAFDTNVVLNDISFSVNKGDIYGVLGLSGAGKSTLVRCLNGLEDIDSGEILYSNDGINQITLASNHYDIKKTEKENRHIEIKVKFLKKRLKFKHSKKTISKIEDQLRYLDNKISLNNKKIQIANTNEIKSTSVSIKREYKREIAMIFQKFNLLDQRTVLRNVELVGELNHTKNYKEKALSCLKMVGLNDKIYSYPSTLSGGQQQRVAIARALMSDPKILLCDEATSALDPETTESILSLLKNLNQELGLTIIIIAHQLKIIESICNKVAIIDKSQIIEKGDLTEVFLNPQSDIAKRLIYAKHINIETDDHNLIRFKFNGDSDKPLISNIIKDLNISVSIVHADTRVVNGKVFGQMLISLTNYDKDIKKLKDYLIKEKINFEEVE